MYFLTLHSTNKLQLSSALSFVILEVLFEYTVFRGSAGPLTLRISPSLVMTEFSVKCFAWFMWWRVLESLLTDIQHLYHWHLLPCTCHFLCYSEPIRTNTSLLKYSVLLLMIRWNKKCRNYLYRTWKLVTFLLERWMNIIRCGLRGGGWSNKDTNPSIGSFQII